MLMGKITWNHQCYFCGRPILRGKPTLIFYTDKPLLLGISHSTCCATKYQYGHFQTCPPNRLSTDDVSFLVHFFPMLHKLPGGSEPNGELRYCLVTMLFDAPDALDNPTKYLRRFQEQNRYKVQSYGGDLESDFLRFLGQVQRVAKENPVDVEVDFRK